MEETVREQHFEKVYVLVETAERSFRGYLHKPIREPNYRLSDHLNDCDKSFINLTQVRINERGQQYRPGDDRPFVAIAVCAIVYIAPVDPSAPTTTR